MADTNNKHDGSQEIDTKKKHKLQLFYWLSCKLYEAG